MTTSNIRHSILASIAAIGLMALPLQAHAAWDYRSIPLIGELIAMFIPPAKPAVTKPAQPVAVYPINQTMPVWSIPQPTAGYTYVNGQAQRVYNVYTPQGQVQMYSVPSNYPIMQQTNPAAAQQIQTQLGVVQPTQTAAWQYQVSPVAYQQTVPNAPQLSGVNMAGTSVTNANSNTLSSNTPAASSNGAPASLNDNRVIDTNASGTYKWPVPTNSSGTSAYVSSVYGMRDRDNFIAGCSDGTAPKTHCGEKMHNGIDLKVASGTPIQSVTSGKVVYIDPYCNHPDAKLEVNKDPTHVHPHSGCAVSILNAKGEMMSYSHLSDPGNLKVGDAINAGDTVGKSGNSGGSFGAHLDLSMCQISDEKVAAAQKAKTNMTRCNSIGGTSLNPLDKLDAKDPRAAAARAKEKMNTTYLACKKAAGKDFAAIQQCRSTFKSKYNKKPLAPNKPMEPLTGKLNMGRN